MIYGLVFGALDLGFMVLVSGFKIQGLEFRVSGVSVWLAFRASGRGRVPGSGALLVLWRETFNAAGCAAP